MLEAIAEGWHIALTDERVPEIVDRLVTEMTTPVNVRSTLQRLNEFEREALAFVAARGEARAHVVVRKYGDLRRLGPGSLEWQKAWRQPASAVERLWFLGLLHLGYAMDDRFHGQFFFVPGDILAILPPMPAPAPTFNATPLPSPAVARNDTDALARGVLAILSHCRNKQVRSRKGELSARELTGLEGRLRPATSRSALWEAQRLRFLRHLTEKAGWLRVQDGLWKPTAEAGRWLKKDATGRQTDLYSAWLEDTNWNELWMMPSVRCENTGWRNDPTFARKAVLSGLTQCPVDTWLGIAALVDSMYDRDPDFMRPDGDYDSWYIRDAQTGQYLTGFSNWHRVEGALVRYILAAPLCWLGVVALGSPQEGTSADRFMLTRLGATILGLLKPETDAIRPFVVQADRQVIVPHNASWYDRFLLERFARWVGEEEGFARYVLDAASVRAGLQQGISTDQVLAFLRRATNNRLPEPVARALKAYGQQSGNSVRSSVHTGRRT